MVLESAFTAHELQNLLRWPPFSEINKDLHTRCDRQANKQAPFGVRQRQPMKDTNNAAKNFVATDGGDMKENIGSKMLL